MRELKLFILRLLAAAFLVAFCMSISRAADAESQSDVSKRLAESSKVLNEIMANPQKAIPAGVISRAPCIAVSPATVQVAVLVGAKHGEGFASCRTENGWSAPVPLDISGGSWGANSVGRRSISSWSRRTTRACSNSNREDSIWVQKRR